VIPPMRPLAAPAATATKRVWTTTRCSAWTTRSPPCYARRRFAIHCELQAAYKLRVGVKVC
jgi:hypothetical protein